MMSDEQSRPIRAWASRLSGEGEPLTMAEAGLLAQIAATDRLLECLTALQDIQMRLTRLEVFVARVFPGYDAQTTGVLKALEEAHNGR